MYQFRSHSLKAMAGLIFCISFLFLQSCQEAEKATDVSSDYIAYENDPLNLRTYTLDNGLTLHLSPNPEEPRIQTLIAVRTGSKNDPAETTGLAHYLEHMMFKGTHDIGTKDWEAEKMVLQKISDLYEEHLNTNDPEQKNAIYQQIDSFSTIAAGYSIPNEYDKMVSSLGAKYTNAYTWLDETVYVNDIPSNEIDRWMHLEANRFKTLVLRLFHTELETVYEEFNRSEDNDQRKAFKALFENVFPTHPYGTQTTLGEGEHLKNPSMVNIHNYFDKYYVPNNVAICLSGDFNPNEVHELAKKYFGDWENKPVDRPQFEQQVPLAASAPIEVKGPNAEFMYMAYRFEGAGSEEAASVELIDAMLANQSAGLIDLNLVQAQKVLSAGSFVIDADDYAVHIFNGTPREGQSLQEVQNLVLAEIEKIKNGDFDDWLPTAVIKYLKLQELQSLESNYGRANTMVYSFINDLDYTQHLERFNRMASLSKEDIMNFAKKHYTDNYVSVFKINGDPGDVSKVEKPPITPIDLEREEQSQFYKDFEAMQVQRLTPVYIDYQKDIEHHDFEKGIQLLRVQNPNNELFELSYSLQMGSDHDKEMALAIDYLPYLGTSKYSPEELQKEFFKLGLSFDVSTSRRKLFISLSGLEESLEEGIKLFEHLLTDVQPDPAALGSLIDGIMKKRDDAKLNKGTILWRGLSSYARYGEKNAFTDKLSEDYMRYLDPSVLTDKIKSLNSLKHEVHYYGTISADDVKGLLAQHHNTPEVLSDYPEITSYPELDRQSTNVYFVDYDMVQTEFLMMASDGPYDNEASPYAQLFNEYFGSGLSSIVFQEIRESKALAYAAFSAYRIPNYPDEHNFVYAYVGTQVDKMKEAMTAMTALMNEMPKVEMQFDNARDAVMKKIETDRTSSRGLIRSYDNARIKGLEKDNREYIYNIAKAVTVDNLEDFFNKRIKGKSYQVCIIGKKSDVDMDALREIGEVQELTLEQVFGY